MLCVLLSVSMISDDESRAAARFALSQHVQATGDLSTADVQAGTEWYFNQHTWQSYTQQVLGFIRRMGRRVAKRWSMMVRGRRCTWNECRKLSQWQKGAVQQLLGARNGDTRVTRVSHTGRIEMNLRI